MRIRLLNDAKNTAQRTHVSEAEEFKFIEGLELVPRANQTHITTFLNDLYLTTNPKSNYNCLHCHYRADREGSSSVASHPTGVLIAFTGMR